MGSAKEQMHDNAIEKRNKELAEYLGISKDELDLTDFDIDVDDIHGVSLITFSENSPKEILDKVPNLIDRSVEVENSIFDDGEFSDDFNDDFNTSGSGFVDIPRHTVMAQANALRKKDEDK